MYKVLIVDDEPHVIEYLCSLVDWNALGFDIFCNVYSAQQAIGIMESTDISVVLLDVMMPGMNGVELSHWIHENHPEIKMVALSGYDDYDYVRKILLNGAEDYILKHRLSAEFLAELMMKLWHKLEDDHVSRHLPLQTRQSIRKDMVAADWESVGKSVGELLQNEPHGTGREILVKELISIMRSFPDTAEYEETIDKAEGQLMAYAMNGDDDRFIDAYIGAASSCHMIDGSLREYSPNVSKALETIESSSSFNISLDDCAKIVGVNTAYLSRVFHQELNLTFTDKLNRVRVRKAKEQMKAGLSLKEIAFECGFKNYNYFFKVFKKVTGLTPLQYQDTGKDG